MEVSWGPIYRLTVLNIDTTIRSIQEIQDSCRPAVTGTERKGASVNKAMDITAAIKSCWKSRSQANQ